MVCVTGDVHQRSYRGVDTPFSTQTEVALAGKYCDIAGRYGVKVSLLFTGRACREEPDTVKLLSSLPHCEIGGHTFAAFRDPLSRLFKKIYGTPWGTTAHQLRDIQRTIAGIQQVTGRRIQTWRNHSYIRTAETDHLLHSCGIRVVSDEVSYVKTSAELVDSGVRSVPMNIQPDHEHVLHGKYQHGNTKPDRLRGRMSIVEWADLVKARIRFINEQGGTATVLAHPLCMEVADGMVVFEELCRYIQQYRSVWLSEVQ
ncbi:MAG: hypothetical protein KC592_11175 [Nitrospira sp.]|nr:hypothetical protein [Nitrospira sp.]